MKSRRQGIFNKLETILKQIILLALQGSFIPRVFIEEGCRKVSDILSL